jgi:hypothetical protein
MFALVIAASLLAACTRALDTFDVTEPVVPDAGVCNMPLPATDRDGEPWPTFTDALGAACPTIDYTRVSHGQCDDGKLFIEQWSGLGGDTRYFRSGALVGVAGWTDVIFPECGAGRSLGDVSCERVEDIIQCQRGFEDAGPPSSRL